MLIKVLLNIKNKKKIKLNKIAKLEEEEEAGCYTTKKEAHIYHYSVVTPDIAAALKIILIYEKRIDIWHLVLLEEKVLSKESPPSITVNRNPNWST